jgi:hypothetical protein
MAKAAVLLVEKTDGKQLDDEQVYEVLARKSSKDVRLY